VAVITVVLLAPAVLVGREIATQATEGVKRIEAAVESGELTASLERNPRTAPLGAWIRNHVDFGKELGDLGQMMRARLGGWLRGAAWTATQFLITIFLLFYLFRDRQEAIRAAVSFFPLSNKEAGEVVGRVRAMIHATIYGTVVVASIQGALGGLMFWILGVPGALLWAVAMGLLSIIPMLGAFVIWVPAAAGLAAQGNWQKALILCVWGTVVVGFIDNLLYPMLVGKETRLHTVPVFIAIIGGLFVFGAPGVVVGPVIFAVTLACLDVLRRRTAGNRSAEETLESPQRRAS
jgi:predicted PurR-regulated permease PerM